MAPTTPQWDLDHFLDLNAIGAIIPVGLFISLWLAMLILYCMRLCGWCCNCRDWFYNNLIKKSVLFVFKDIIHETCSQPGATTVCCCCNHDKQLKFGDVAVKPNREGVTILWLFMLLFMTFTLAVTAFWNLFLFAETDRSHCVPGLACFDSNSTTPINCDLNQCTTPSPDCDRDSLNSTTLVCFQLVLDFPLAGGVATGLFALVVLIIQFVFLIRLSIWKKHPVAMLLAQYIGLLVCVAILLIAILVPVLSDFLFDNFENGVQFMAVYLAVTAGLYFPFAILLEIPSSSERMNNYGT